MTLQKKGIILAMVEYSMFPSIWSFLLENLILIQIPRIFSCLIIPSSWASFEKLAFLQTMDIQRDWN